MEQDSNQQIPYQVLTYYYYHYYFVTCYLGQLYMKTAVKGTDQSRTPVHLWPIRQFQCFSLFAHIQKLGFE